MNISLKTEEVNKLSKEEIFDIIQLYILELKDLSIRKTQDEASFDKPAWSEYQAYQLGYQKALNKLATFIPLPKENNFDN